MKGEINTIYLVDKDDVDVFKGKDNRYHYFYKIVNELNNHYYYGIHSTDNLDDNYKGSGYRLKGVYKKYGLKKFTKYILRFFDTRKELLQYEREIVTHELCNEHNCYNIALGGNGVESLLINVRDKNGDWVQITRDEYVNNPNVYVHHSKGRVVLNNGAIHKYVLLNDLDRYLSEGWVRGEIEHSTKNRINIKKNNKQKFIYEDDLDRYLSEGWYVGICQKTTKGYIKLTNGSENVSIDPCKTEQIKYYIDLGWTYGVSREVAKHVWINNTIESKMILESDLDKYLSEGWVQGRAQNDMPKRKRNVAVVSKNGKAIQINKDDLDKYLSEGWVRGNCNINPITNNGKTVVNKDGINKFVKLDDLDKYLSEGWVKGKINKKSLKN